MLERLDMPPPEKILQIAADFAADPREEKIDLGVGVFKNDAGVTAILKTVKKVEKIILESQDSKSYIGLLGDVVFNKAVGQVILGQDAAWDRISAIQTPGGSGALRLLFELVNYASPGATVWVPEPTWANHLPTLVQAGLAHKSYSYFDTKTLHVNFDAMLASLETIPAGDILLLHGCCHNPTGANLSPDQWDEIAGIVERRGIIPFVDIAYQGFGDGLEKDAYGVRALAKRVPEMFIASSCSKNFAIYRERTGLAMVLSKDSNTAKPTIARLKTLARANHSMPPDHGAAIVRSILTDPTLRGEWLVELEAMRSRIADLREQLAETFRTRTNSDRYDFLAEHRGMFSLIGISPEQVKRLRDDHAIYMVEDSRINIAGLKNDQIDRFVEAVVAVGG